MNNLVHLNLDQSWGRLDAYFSQYCLQRKYQSFVWWDHRWRVVGLFHQFGPPAYILNLSQKDCWHGFQQSHVCETARPSFRLSRQASSASAWLEQRSYPPFKAWLLSRGCTYISCADLIVSKVDLRLLVLAKTPSLTLNEKSIFGLAALAMPNYAAFYLRKCPARRACCSVRWSHSPYLNLFAEIIWFLRSTAKCTRPLRLHSIMLLRSQNCGRIQIWICFDRQSAPNYEMRARPALFCECQSTHAKPAELEEVSAIFRFFASYYC